MRSRRFAAPLLIALGIALSQPAQAGGFFEKLKEYCEGKGAAACLVLLLDYKCASYANPADFLDGSAFQRWISIGRFVHAIELEALPGEAKYVVFHDHLSRLLSDEWVRGYLDSIPREIARAAREERVFQLWTHTLRWLNGDRARALEWIAVLFQDTTEDEVLTSTFRMPDGEALSGPLIASWKAALTALSPASESTASVQPYPPELDFGSLNPAFYHFYFSALASSLLEAEGRKLDSFFIPFLFNTVYEFSELGPAGSVTKDPEPFRAEEYRWKLQDLYGGFLGSLFGIGAQDRAENFEEFSNALSRDPSGAMKRWFKEKI